MIFNLFLWWSFPNVHLDLFLLVSNPLQQISEPKMKQCSFCSSKTSVFLLSQELKIALKIPQELWSAFTHICTDHFDPADVTTGQRQRLKSDAFPTIFPQLLKSYFDQFFESEVSMSSKKSMNFHVLWKLFLKKFFSLCISGFRWCIHPPRFLDFYTEDGEQPSRLCLPTARH